MPFIHFSHIGRFRGWAARAYTLEDVDAFVSTMFSDRSVARAHHAVVLYRLSNPFAENYWDGGCDGTGATIMYQMQKMHVLDVVVLATRWYGGILLYSDRFKHFNSVAAGALRAGPFAEEGEQYKLTEKAAQKEKDKQDKEHWIASKHRKS